MLFGGEKMIWDVFIAYHGSYESKNGSQEKAREIYDFLKEKNGINCYFFPECGKGNFGKTTIESAHSRLFLLVANATIASKLDEVSGEIREGEPIFEEMNAFYQNQMRSHDCSNNPMRVYCYDGYKDEQADLIFPVATKNVEHFDVDRDGEEKTKIKMLNWVKHTLEKPIHSSKKEKSKSVIHSRFDETSVWNSDLASTWHKISPPSRPSESEIEIYRKYLRFIRNNSNHAICKALILGSTIEFRQLTSSEQFHTTVVDVSEEYYNEISKELKQPLDNEQVVFCNWLNMSDNLDVESYDVVLGDLSIGNVEPNSIVDFVNQVSKMLCVGGFFLGKTLFRFNNKSYSRTDIYRLFDKYFELKKDKEYQKTNLSKLNDLNNEEISPYGFSMYPLSVFAMDKNKKINFVNLYNLVCEIKKNTLENKNDPIFSIYTDGETSFKEKMKLNFYIYNISEFVQICYNDFKLYDIEYGNDIYSEDFPLLILRKRMPKDKKSHNISVEVSVAQTIQDIADFIINNGNLVKDWSKHISSQYFLLCTVHILNSKGYLPHLVEKIYNQILTSVKECLDFSVDQNMNSIIVGIHDDKIDFETLNKCPDLQSKISNKGINIEETNEKEIINSYTNIPLKNNYALGLLAYITWFVSGEKKSDTCKMVISKLFSNIERGSLWNPKDSIWLSARIVIALSPMFSSLYPADQSKIIDVIKKISFSYSRENHIWEEKLTNLGSTTNTLSLCILSLLEYRDLLIGKKIIINTIDANFKDLISYYIVGSNIYDTIVRFYIGFSKEKLANGDINFYQKINDNISVISAFIRLIDYCIVNNIIPEDSKEELTKAKEQLIDVLFDFWSKFKINAQSINQTVQQNEYSLVPQIIYSCLSPGLLINNIKEKEEQ